jgi:hypothetical protein
MKEDTLQFQNKTCFQNALILALAENDSLIDNSPSIDMNSSLNDLLPYDLLEKIDRISSSSELNISAHSNKVSEDDLCSNTISFENEADTADNSTLNQYHSLSKYPKSTSSSSLLNAYYPSSISFTYRNSILLNNNNNSNDYFTIRKMSEQNVPLWNSNYPLQYAFNYEASDSNNSNSNNNVVYKSKKKNKKKKKKNKDEFTIEMFGRRGWICEQCNNFNYDSRNKCNRCGILKQAKIINYELLPSQLSTTTTTQSHLSSNKSTNSSDDNEDKNVKTDLNINYKGDWICTNCNNLNYAFRLTCNRCQVVKNEQPQMSSLSNVSTISGISNGGN